MSRHAVPIDCPCCHASVVAYIIPEEPMVLYYPDGSGYPGSPAELDEVDGCECWDYLEAIGKGDGYRRDVMDTAAIMGERAGHV